MVRTLRTSWLALESDPKKISLRHISRMETSCISPKRRLGAMASLDQLIAATALGAAQLARGKKAHKYLQHARWLVRDCGCCLLRFARLPDQLEMSRRRITFVRHRAKNWTTSQ